MPKPPTTRTHADGFKGEYPKYVDLSALPPAKFPWLTVPDDEDLFEWRDAVLLRPGAQPVDHRVPLVNGRVPGEFDRPRGDGSYDRWRLVVDDGAVASYEWVAD